MSDYSLNLVLDGDTDIEDAEERISEFMEKCGGVYDGGGTDFTTNQRDVFGYFPQKDNAERCVQMVNDFGINIVRYSITECEDHGDELEGVRFIERDGMPPIEVTHHYLGENHDD